MSGIESELDEYMKKNNVQDFLNSIVLKVLEHKPENPLFYLYIQKYLILTKAFFIDFVSVISKEKNEKAKYLLECYYDLMAYKGRPETEKNILPDLFHKLTTIDPHSYQGKYKSAQGINIVRSNCINEKY